MRTRSIPALGRKAHGIASSDMSADLHIAVTCDAIHTPLGNGKLIPFLPFGTG